MEAIEAVIQASRRQMTTPCSSTLPTAQNLNKAYMTKYRSPSDLETSFSPIHWGYVMNNVEKAYRTECPTIFDYSEKFGIEYAAMWIRSQVMALYGSSSNREKGVADGIKLFCDSFTAQVKGFKLSELMLFFARYKAGRYDNSFASFDARRIGNAFFKEFIPERNMELDSFNRKMEQDKIEQRRFTPPQGYTSLSWYNELKKRAESGDEAATKLIAPP